MSKFDRLTKNIPRIYQPAVNKFIKSILSAWGESDDAIEAALTATKDQLFIETASGQYLDRLGSNVGVARPAQIGIGDDNFRHLIPAMSYTPKQVREVLWKLLEIFYGSQSVYANIVSENSEPFVFISGENITFTVDGETDISIVFNTSDFINIAVATAQEVSDAINKQALDLHLEAEVLANSITHLNYVRVKSTTPGPMGSIIIKNGYAQNALQFPSFLMVGNTIGTQWDVTPVTADQVRLEWTGVGPMPDLKLTQVGDLMIVRSPYISGNQGWFTLTDVVVAAIVDGVTPGHKFTGNYVEFVNLTAVAETTIQTSVSDVTFTAPHKVDMTNLPLPATAYEVNPRELVVLLPSTAGQVIRRELIGSAHLHPNSTMQLATLDNITHVSGIQIQAGEILRGEIALYMAGGTGNFVINELVQGAISLQLAQVYKVITNNLSDTILAVRNTAGGFIAGEAIVGLTSGASRNFVTIVSPVAVPSATMLVDCVIDPISTLSVQNIVGIFTSGEALVGRNVVWASRPTAPFALNETFTTLGAGHATLHLRTPWFGAITVGMVLKGVISGAKATVQHIVVNKIDGAIVLDVDTIIGAFIAGEQVFDFPAGIVFGTFDKLLYPSGATATLSVIEEETTEELIGELINFGINFAFVTDEIIVGGTSGSMAIFGVLQAPLATYVGIQTLPTFVSPYVYYNMAPYTSTSVIGTINQNILGGVPITVLQCVALSTDWPDIGYIVIDRGTDREEGPIQYFAKPNSYTLNIDPSYLFTKIHSVGATIQVVTQGPTIPASNGSDYATYVTGLAEARILLQDLVRTVVAAGIVIRFIIAFPDYRFYCYQTNL